MTDSEIASSVPDKRERLVRAARQLVHAQGVERTSLAEIARVADVPVGNIYYYFKTKDSLVTAVVDSYKQGQEEFISALDTLDSPQGRLHGLVSMWVDRRETVAEHGCPFGSLASEVDKVSPGTESGTARVMTGLLDWVEKQFRSMGQQEPRILAVALIAAYQGICVLTNTLRDPGLLSAEGRRLDAWIDSLS
jgi:TetR/AcrR family transcriptional regulator, transcriptional repressor for nem operon